MSSIMRARSGLMGVSLIGVLLVLRLGFGHPHPQARALQIPLPLALPGLNAASARVIAAGYRVSGFVQWHEASVRVGPRITSENGITLAVGKALPARGKLTHSSPRCAQPVAMQQSRDHCARTDNLK